MAGEDQGQEYIFNKAVQVHAPATAVWALLTQPPLMKKWMPEAVTDIITDWQQGGPFIIRGQLYKKPFENKGTVISFHPPQLLEYTHLSSLSRLPDVPENYTIMSFRLDAVDDGTRLALAINNFPTETIYRHLAFYWNVTLELLKKMVEKQGQ